MKKNITLSINPTYQCNFRCKFCYLSTAELSDPKTASLDEIDSRLKEISLEKMISHVDLYGGEIGLLKEGFFEDLKTVIRNYYSGPISIVSNGSVIRDFFLTDDIDLTISWDYLAREKHEKVYRNICALTKNTHILLLASQDVLNFTDKDILDYVNLLNQANSVVSLEIKPYSTNRNNSQSVSFRDFEKFLVRFLNIKSLFEFEFINETNLKNVLESTRNAWSDDHLYITPDAKLAVLDFHEDGTEYFMPLNNLDEYKAWSENEKIKVYSNIHCATCNYTGRCLSEHLRPIENIADSCSGFKNLIDYYAEELYETT